MIPEVPVRSEVFDFGPFRMHPDRRLLLRHDEPVQLGSRAFDILLALAERAGEIVRNEELLARVWPDTFVEQANLRVHIAALRKALGGDQAYGRVIETVPGRGYSFVAELKRSGMQEEVSRDAATVVRPSALPSAVARVFGRDETVQSVSSLLSARRAVTLVGPGGIGKTTVAFAAGRMLEPTYRDGVIFFDLSSLRDPLLIPSALAGQLGHAILSSDPISDLIGALGERRLLLIFDSCEHLIDGAASVAEALLQRTTGVDILATSREPLRIAGEWVQRLAGLEVPLATEIPAPEEALLYSAVELFVDRAAASLGGYVLTEEDVPEVIEICRRLDGIALALELAAARLDATGVRALARSLDDRFKVLTRGRRTALPRHQTLRATHDWSYDLLTAAEKLLLRHLSVFSGDVTARAAQAVALGLADVDEHLASLASKSLLIEGKGRSEPTYRLLDTTRAYASDKLAAAAEQAAARCRHAEFLMNLFERAGGEWETRVTTEWLAEYGQHLGDVRLALDWAFGDEGEVQIGVALTVAAIPIWFQLSLLDECLAGVQRALRALDHLNGDTRRWKMQLCAALGWPQMRPIAQFQSGRAAWETTLNLAEEIGDNDYQERALWALWVDAHNRGEPREALGLAERFRALCDLTQDSSSRAIGHRMRARSLHLLGDPQAAQNEISLMLKDYVAPLRRSHTARLQYDQVVTAHITLQRALWLVGFPDAAMRDVENNLEVARSIGHGLTLSHALSDGACPVALLARDLSAAEKYISMLYEQTSANALDVWHTYAEAFDGELKIRRGDLSAGVQSLHKAVAILRERGFVLYLTSFLGVLGEAMAGVGERREGLVFIDEAIGRCDRSGEAWCLAELWRLRAVALGPEASAEAEACLRRALDIARGQGALSWELRAAASLGRLSAGRGDHRSADEILAPVLARFSEGFARPDLADARADLARWRVDMSGEAAV